MKAADAIRQITAKSQWSQNRLGVALGYTPQAMVQALGRKDMRCGLVARTLDLLGYELWAVPKGTRVPSGSIQITAPEQEGGE